MGVIPCGFYPRTPDRKHTKNAGCIQTGKMAVSRPKHSDTQASPRMIIIHRASLTIESETTMSGLRRGTFVTFSYIIIDLWLPSNEIVCFYGLLSYTSPGQSTPINGMVLPWSTYLHNMRKPFLLKGNFITSKLQSIYNTNWCFQCSQSKQILIDQVVKNCM